MDKDTANLIAALESDNHEPGNEGVHDEYINWLKSMGTMSNMADNHDRAQAGIRWIDGDTGEVTFQVAEVEIDPDGNVNLNT